MIAGAPRPPEALLDFKYIGTFSLTLLKGTAVQAENLLPVWRRPLRIPTLVAARPRLVLIH